MKKNMIIAMTAMFLLAGTFTANAQTEAKNQSSAQKRSTPLATGRGDGGEAYTPEQVDQRAMFPGGQEGMMSYMMQNMKYPKEAEKDKARGTVVVHFVVEADGSISNAHVPDSLKVHPALDAAAVQFVKAMPKWKPARLKGKTVRQRASHAISYRYQ
jgi:protein TonB